MLKEVKDFLYFGCLVGFLKKDIEMWIGLAWSALFKMEVEDELAITNTALQICGRNSSLVWI